MQGAWAITAPVGRKKERLIYTWTIARTRREAVAKFKAEWPAEMQEAKWDEYRTKHDHRVERIVLTLADEATP